MKKVSRLTPLMLIDTVGEVSKSAHQWQWLSLDQLPDFALMVDDIWQDTQEMSPLLAQVKEKPWVLDDAIIQRTIRHYTERLAMLDDHSQQIDRWRKDPLTAPQTREIDRLESTTRQTIRLTHSLLTLVRELDANT